MHVALGAVAVLFVQLSLLAVGGANALVPEMQRALDARGWIGPSEFAALFALAQAAPGPNMLVVTLVGWHVAGWAGAATATAGFVAPAGLLAYFASRAWERFRDARWRRVAQAALTPVTVGLVISAAALLCGAAVHGPTTALLALGTAGLVLGTRLHPLALLAAGAGLGALGLP